MPKISDEACFAHGKSGDVRSFEDIENRDPVDRVLERPRVELGDSFECVGTSSNSEVVSFLAAWGEHFTKNLFHINELPR